MSKGHAKTPRRIGGSILPKSTRGRRLLWFDSPSPLFLDLTIDQSSIPLRSVQHLYLHQSTMDIPIDLAHRHPRLVRLTVAPGRTLRCHRRTPWHAGCTRRPATPASSTPPQGPKKQRDKKAHHTHTSVYFVCRESKLLQLNFPDTENSRNEHLPLFALPHAVVPQAVVPQAVVPHVQNPKACVGSASRAPKLP